MGRMWESGHRLDLEGLLGHTCMGVCVYLGGNVARDGFPCSEE